MGKIVIANWKANKSIHETSEWIKNTRSKLEESENKIVVAPDFVSLPIAASLLKGTSLGVCAQDVSMFERGPYTGEVVAEVLKELVEYVLVTHSERRKYFQEDDSTAVKKVKMALKYGLKPVLCVEGSEELRDYLDLGGEYKGILVAYEPIESIGTGKPEEPARAREVLDQLRSLLQAESILYGGSVTDQNVSTYVDLGFDGVLVGNASLDSEEFCKILESV